MTATREDTLTAGQALDRAVRRLSEGGIDTARIDARLLLSHATGRDRSRLVVAPDDPLSPDDWRRFRALVERRLCHEPVSHLTGTREFWSLPFRVNSDVLDPRPDSETLVEVALALFPKAGLEFSVLDLGAGSGCLLLSVLHERPGARGVAVDLSEKALELARTNAARLGLADRASFVRGDWGTAIGASFDLILCNPPYVARGDIDSLSPEVANFEPRTALDGGADGLDAYRAILPRLGNLLAPEGRAVVEIGAGQAAPVHALAAENDLRVVETRRDLSYIERCVVFRRSAVFTDT